MSGVRYALWFSPGGTYARISTMDEGQVSERDPADAEEVLVNLDTGGKERGRSLAKHIQALLNEHPHEWPRKRAKKARPCTHINYEHLGGMRWRCTDCGHSWEADE